MNRPTLNDVAMRAGVSRSTASSALRATSKVSARTRQRVQKAAEEIGYQRRWAASSLRSGDGRLVAAIVDPQTIYDPTGKPHLFWADALFHFALELEQRGISMVLSDMSDLDAINELPVDAVVLVSGGLPTLPDQLPFNLPIIAFDEEIDDPRVSVKAWRDYKLAACLILQHLRDQGATHVGYIPRQPSLKYSRRLTEELEVWASEHDLPFTVIDHAGSMESVASGMSQALDSGVDGLFAMTGTPRMLKDMLHEFDLSYPADILLVSNGVGWIEEYSSPTVTTLTFEPRETAVLLAEAVDRTVNQGEYVDVELPCALDVRESSQREG